MKNIDQQRANQKFVIGTKEEKQNSYLWTPYQNNNRSAYTFD